MSFILRDPFFDGFDDMMEMVYPFGCLRRSPVSSIEDEEVSGKRKNQNKKARASREEGLIARMNRDHITPFCGFGRMDMHESDTSYELSVDMPGMEKSNIEVTAEDNTLVIKGERKQEKKEEDKKGKYHFVERHFGSFHREMSIPKNADAEKINAVYENGVLKVTIPKIPSTSTKKAITVN